MRPAYDLSFRVLIVGDTGVGKTSILQRYIHGKCDTITHTTIGTDFVYDDRTIEGRRVRVQFWDTAGRESFRNITRSYYRGSDLFLVVFDAGRPETFDNVHKWVADIRNSQTVARIILVANKEGGNVEAIALLAKETGCRVIDVSARTGTNISYLFSEIARTLLWAARAREPWPEEAPRTQPKGRFWTFFSRLFGFRGA